MSKKDKIVITGGAGFVGTNLIKLFIKKTSYKIISIDDYSSGSKKNHIKDKRIKYINGSSKNINKLINKPKEIKSIFHFGEFARIYQSFLQMNQCIESNTIGLNAVFNFCLKNNIVNSDCSTLNETVVKKSKRWEDDQAEVTVVPYSFVFRVKKTVQYLLHDLECEENMEWWANTSTYTLLSGTSANKIQFNHSACKFADQLYYLPENLGFDDNDEEININWRLTIFEFNIEDVSIIQQ